MTATAQSRKVTARHPQPAGRPWSLLRVADREPAERPRQVELLVDHAGAGGGPLTDALRRGKQ